MEASALDRFEAKTSRVGDCVLWTASKTTNGYGRFKVGSKMHMAHRWRFELAHGPIPRRLVVMHSCDVRACVNLNHLSLGTTADNIRDAAGKGRLVGRPSATRATRDRLTASAVLDIRERCARGESRTEIGALYHVSQEQVSNIYYDRSWRAVRGPRGGVHLEPTDVHQARHALEQAATRHAESLADDALSDRRSLTLDELMRCACAFRAANADDS